MDLGVVMSDQTESRAAAASSRDPVINPAPIETINRMGSWYLILTVLFFYLLLAAWPVEQGGKSFRPTNLFGFVVSWAPDRQMIFTVMMAGALGSLTHTLTSFGDYVGNRELSTNWIWFLVLRIPIGIALALLFYFIIRGGLLIPTVQVQGQQALDAHLATLQVNPYSIAAFSALAGMFSKQATDKLAAVFEVVFAMKKPVEREGALGSTLPLKIVPPVLTKARREDLTVTGRGFQDDTRATINGKDRRFKRSSETEGTISLLDEDVKETGELNLVVTNPNKDSFKATIKVIAASQGVKPVISSTAPVELTKDSPKSLTVNGKNFQTGCTATIGGETRVVTAGDDKTITVTLLDKDVAAPCLLKLIVKNPGADGQASDVRDITVK